MRKRMGDGIERSFSERFPGNSLLTEKFCFSIIIVCGCLFPHDGVALSIRGMGTHRYVKVSTDTSQQDKKTMTETVGFSNGSSEPGMV